MPMPSAIAGGPLVGMAKPPLQVQTLPGALWQDGAVYGNVYNYQTTPVTFDQGPINLDFLNQMPPTAVPFFPPSPNQVVSYDQMGHSGSIPTTIVGNELNHPGDFGQVYMRDDENQASNMWVLDYYNETAGNGPSMLYSLTYPHPANESNDDQTDSNDGSVYGVAQAPDMP
jgi:hypothetical protein